MVQGSAHPDYGLDSGECSRVGSKCVGKVGHCMSALDVRAGKMMGKRVADRERRIRSGGRIMKVGHVYGRKSDILESGYKKEV